MMNGAHGRGRIVSLDECRLARIGHLSLPVLWRELQGGGGRGDRREEADPGKHVSECESDSFLQKLVRITKKDTSF